jgi:hypothetical protein
MKALLLYQNAFTLSYQLAHPAFGQSEGYAYVQRCALVPIIHQQHEHLILLSQLGANSSFGMLAFGLPFFSHRLDPLPKHLPLHSGVPFELLVFLSFQIPIKYPCNLLLI